MEDNQVTYHIQILDNGIMFRDIENELFECKEFSGNGGEKDEAINKYLGLNLCLMKYIGHYNNRGWELCQYAYTEHRTSICGDKRDFYHAVGGEIYAECIPYNDQTAHLLGATDKWKGGEG